MARSKAVVDKTGSSANAYVGHFAAGAGAVPVNVAVVPTRARLEIRDGLGLLIAAWAWPDTVVLAAPSPRHPLRLTCRDYPDQCLEVHDAADLAEALGAPFRTDTPPSLPAVRRAEEVGEEDRPFPRKRRWGLPRIRLGWPTPMGVLRGVLRLMAATGLLLIGAGVTLVLPGVASLGVPLIPAGVEAAWGASMVEQLRDHGLLACKNIYGRQALDRLGDRLREASGAPWPVVIHVIQDPRMQVLTLPGGHIVLFEGVVDHVRTADELAAVVAQALAHGVRRDTFRALVARDGAGILGALIREQMDDPRLSVEHYLISRDFSLSETMAADARAVSILRQADMRARGLILFLEWAETQPADMAPLGRGAMMLKPYMAMHPPHPDRLRALRLVPRGGEPAMDPMDWAGFRIVCN